MSEWSATIRGTVLLALAIALFSTVETGTRSIVLVVRSRGGTFGLDEALGLTAVRFLLGAAVLIGLNPSGLFGELRTFSAGRIVRVGLAGVLGVPAAIGLFHASLAVIGAAPGAAIFSANPLFATLFAAWLLRERAGRRHLLGVGCGLVGLALLVYGEWAGDGRAALGAVGMAVAGALFALFVVAIRRLQPGGRGGQAITGLAFASGAVPLLPFLRHAGVLFATPETAAWTFHLGVAGTGIGYLCFLEGVRIAGVARGSAVFFAKPFLAAALAVWLLDEPLKPLLVAGTLVVAAGLWLSFSRPAEPA